MDVDRVAATNPGGGANVVAGNQCGDFPFRLVKMQDPRIDVKALANYKNNLVAYVGARNWNNFKWKQNYTSNAQLKFSNVKIPGDKFLIDMKWWVEYKVTISFNNFPYLCKANGKIDDNGFMGVGNLFYLNPYPLHQCTENIHLRLTTKISRVIPFKCSTRGWNTGGRKD